VRLVASQLWKTILSVFVIPSLSRDLGNVIGYLIGVSGLRTRISFHKNKNISVKVVVYPSMQMIQDADTPQGSGLL